MRNNIIINKENILESYLSSSQDLFMEDTGTEGSSLVGKTFSQVFGEEIPNCDFKITTDKAYKELTSVYKRARDCKKVLEDARKKLTEPYRRRTLEINEKAKELSNVLDNIIDTANRRGAEYIQFIEEQRKKKEEELKEKAALLDLDTEEVVTQEVAPVGHGAQMITRKEIKFRVLDISKVPTNYLLVDTKLVERDLKLGILEIPGLEIYEETITSLRKTS